MKKIKSSNKNQYGKNIILPGEGEVKVSDDGIVEVKDDAIADMLVKNSPNWKYVKGKDVKGKDVDLEEDVEVENPDEDISEVSEEVEDPTSPDSDGGEVITEKEKTTAEVREAFKEKLTLNEMIEVASVAKISKVNIEKYSKNKILMANFLIGKLGVEKIKKILG